MKEMKSSLEKGLNDDLPENVSFFNTCGVLHKYCLTLSCAIVRIRTIGRGLQKNGQRTFA